MTVADADLHALVDGQLSGRALDNARLRLAMDRIAAARAARWIAAREALRARLAPVIEEPLPLRLNLAFMAEPDAGAEWRRRLQFALGFMAGFGVGLAMAAAVFWRAF